MRDKKYIFAIHTESYIHVRMHDDLYFHFHKRVRVDMTRINVRQHQDTGFVTAAGSCFFHISANISGPDFVSPS